MVNPSDPTLPPPTLTHAGLDTPIQPTPSNPLNPQTTMKLGSPLVVLLTTVASASAFVLPAATKPTTTCFTRLQATAAASVAPAGTVAASLEALHDATMAKLASTYVPVPSCPLPAWICVCVRAFG